MKHLKLYISILALLGLFATSCKKSEGHLLEPKVYFAQEEQTVEIEDIDTYDYELVSRLSTLVNQEVNVQYEIGDSISVKQYNEKYGTKYLSLPTENFVLENNQATIKEGSIYSSSNKLTLKNLTAMEEGNTFLVPIKIKSATIPFINASNTLYVIVKKPIVIKRVYDFNGNYLSIPMPSTAVFKSVTYEALIYGDKFVWIKTILGREGILMLRFGDTTIDDDQIQIAGSIQFNATPKFQTKKWYHVAFVFDGSTKKATIYINGEKVADKTVDVSSIDLTKDFFIGYAYDYDARRIWYGKMSECRVWNVARTEAQIRNNMLSVDPTSEGLFGYWKLNGSDYYEQNNKYYVKDQSGNGIDAVSRVGAYFSGNGRSVEPSVVDLKVDLK